MIREASGTITADGTEQVLASLTGAKSFMFLVSAVNMANGDTLELRISERMLVIGDPFEVAYFAQFTDAQLVTDILKVSVPTPSDVEIQFTLKQTAGTFRSFKWKVLSV